MVNPPPPGYPGAGYPNHLYGPPPGYLQPDLKPGAIPLRPLSLNDIYSGAAGYIRANPRLVLGLTAAVVVSTQILTALAQIALGSTVHAIGRRGWIGEVTPINFDAPTVALVGASMITPLTTIALSGVLTVAVARAVTGSTIRVSETWALIRDRLGALFGFVALFAVAGVLVCVLEIGAVLIVMQDTAGRSGPVLTAGIAVGLGVMVAAVYGYVVLAFTPTVIVLEHRPISGAMRRSWALVRHSFWRVLGILALTALITALISSAVAFPFDVIGAALSHNPTELTASAQAGLIPQIGSALGQIIGLPFTAGVTMLLYADRRFRAETFDAVLRSAFLGGPWYGMPADLLWRVLPPT